MVQDGRRTAQQPFSIRSRKRAPPAAPLVARARKETPSMKKVLGGVFPGLIALLIAGLGSPCSWRFPKRRLCLRSGLIAGQRREEQCRERGHRRIGHQVERARRPCREQRGHRQRNRFEHGAGGRSRGRKRTSTAGKASSLPAEASPTVRSAARTAEGSVGHHAHDNPRLRDRFTGSASHDGSSPESPCPARSLQ